MKKNFNNNEEVITAIDIGTTKICVLIGKKLNNQDIEIIGIGNNKSYGMAKGMVVNIAQAVESIKLAIKEAELSSGHKIHNAVVGISGSHIKAINSNGMVPIKKERVSQEDIKNVLNAAKTVSIPDNQQIIHIMPQFFIIDSEHKVLNPMGMFGIRLEVKVHIITGSISAIQNIIKCCELSGINISDVVLEQIASAYAVLSEDEKFLGTGILDIGGGTSDFAIYQNKTIKYTKVFTIAGNHITNDIALCLRTRLKDAERIKCEFGNVVINKNDAEKNIYEIEEAQGNSKKVISLQELTSIIEPRITELLELLKNEIKLQNLKHFIPAGIVLTGGGSLLKNINLLCKDIIDIPVRIGYPKLLTNNTKELLNSPIYATAYGLLLYIIKQNENNYKNYLTENLINRIFGKMRSWLTDFF